MEESYEHDGLHCALLACQNQGTIESGNSLLMSWPTNQTFSFTIVFITHNMGLLNYQTFARKDKILDENRYIENMRIYLTAMQREAAEMAINAL